MSYIEKLNTPTVRHQQKMQKILKFLQERYNVNYFSFTRRFNSNTPPFTISTNIDWHVRYKMEYEKVDSFLNIETVSQYSEYYLWEIESLNSAMERYMHEERISVFNILPGISIIQKFSTYVDTFSFSSLHHAVNRQNMLLNLAAEVKAICITIAADLQPLIKNHIQLQQGPPQKKLTTNGSNIMKYYNNLPTLDIKLTQRQIECIYCAAQGLSSKETARILGISQRTVEAILHNCLLKLACDNKCQLVYACTKYGMLADDLIPTSFRQKIVEIFKISKT